MIYSLFVLLSATTMVAAHLRGEISTLAAPVKSPTTCPGSNAPGVPCTEIRCFLDKSNYQIASQPDEFGVYSMSVKNCIPRSATSSISFISVSDCGSSCQKTNTVMYGTQVYSTSFGPEEYCKTLCFYVHDGQYKLSAPNNVTLMASETNCVASSNQRCNLCNLRMQICRRTPSPTEKPSAAPTYEPTAIPTFEPSAIPTAIPTYAPTEKPSAEPTFAPTAEPTANPTEKPSFAPTYAPTAEPTATPTEKPTFAPTHAPTVEPTFSPTQKPTVAPTTQPTYTITEQPTYAVSGDGTCDNSACTAGSCCCTETGKPTFCAVKAEYGGDNVDCKYICGNARCTRNGQIKFGAEYTCGCINNCASNSCNALGGGGGGCYGTSVCCCAVRVSAASTVTTFGGACPSCLDGVKNGGWDSAAYCAYTLNLASAK